MKNEQFKNNYVKQQSRSPERRKNQRAHTNMEQRTNITGTREDITTLNFPSINTPNRHNSRNQKDFDTNSEANNINQFHSPML